MLRRYRVDRVRGCVPGRVEWSLYDRDRKDWVAWFWCRARAEETGNALEAYNGIRRPTNEVDAD